MPGPILPAALVLALLPPLRGTAQTFQPTISTDRPTVTTGTGLAPRHGFLIQSDTNDFAFAYLLDNLNQLDLRAGSAIDSAGVHPIVGIGYSVLFSPRMPRFAALSQ